MDIIQRRIQHAKVPPRLLKSFRNCEKCDRIFIPRNEQDTTCTACKHTEETI